MVWARARDGSSLNGALPSVLAPLRSRGARPQERRYDPPVMRPREPCRQRHACALVVTGRGLGDEAHSEAQRVKSENVIRKSHEDFDELRQSDQFHNWADEQPKWVKDALYENMDDPASVVRVIDLFKIDNGMTIAAKKQSRKAAASTVAKGTRTSVDAKGVQGQIKESDVARMSSKEFEEMQDKINEAMRNGKFVYDMSGSAR